MLTSIELPASSVMPPASEEAVPADVVKLALPAVASDLTSKFKVKNGPLAGIAPVPVRAAKMRSLPSDSLFVTMTACCV
ncbi:hypothetical protein D3C85_1747630 [compost metagenome]